MMMKVYVKTSIEARGLNWMPCMLQTIVITIAVIFLDSPTFYYTVCKYSYTVCISLIYLTLINFCDDSDD
jgi:hypothetical protein